MEFLFMLAVGIFASGAAVLILAVLVGLVFIAIQSESWLERDLIGLTIVIIASYIFIQGYMMMNPIN